MIVDATGEADFDNAIKVSGGIAAHQTNKGVISFESNTLLIRSYGASAGNGLIQFNVAGGGGSADVAAMTIEANKNVTIEDGNLVVGTAGHGIDFTAADSGLAGASGNLLDDYEEGLFDISLNSGGFTVNSSYRVWGYVKIGQLVTVTGLILSTDGGDSNVVIANLPFAALAQPTNGAVNFVSSVISHGVPTGSGGLSCRIDANTSLLRFVKIVDNAAWVDLVGTEIASGNHLYVNISYQVA